MCILYEFQVSSGLQSFEKQAADSPRRTEDMRSKQQPRPSFRWPQQRGDNVTGKYQHIYIYINKYISSVLVIQRQRLHECYLPVNFPAKSLFCTCERV